MTGSSTCDCSRDRACPSSSGGSTRRKPSEIRIYLHGGDDTALVTGTVEQSIPVRIIGGNGTNLLIDSSLVGGARIRPASTTMQR